MGVKEVVGIEQKKGSFISADGRTVEYNNVHLHLLCENSNVEGHAVSVLKVKAELADGIQVGDSILLNYDVRNDGTPYLCNIEVINE